MCPTIFCPSKSAGGAPSKEQGQEVAPLRVDTPCSCNLKSSFCAILALDRSRLLTPAGFTAPGGAVFALFHPTLLDPSQMVWVFSGSPQLTPSKPDILILLLESSRFTIAKPRSTSLAALVISLLEKLHDLLHEIGPVSAQKKHTC